MGIPFNGNLKFEQHGSGTGNANIALKLTKGAKRLS